MVFSQGDLGITPEQISLDTQGLPYSWQAVTVPETPYDESQPPGPKGLPEHIEIRFGVTDPADRQPYEPIMYIIPVNDYREMWEAAGNTWVSDTMSMIEQYSFALPAPAPTSGMPALPPEVIGVASFGQTGTVVGVSEDSEWWVIHVPDAPNEQGRASADYVAVENADNVPVIPAPPPDQAGQLPVQPTATPQVAQPIAPTPTSSAPSAIVFEADSTDIDAGETATLSWSVENIQEVYMYPVGGDFTDYPVEGQGSREVSPGITTSYELLVFLTDDETASERIEISVDDGFTSGEWILASMSSPSVGMVIPISGTELTADFESNGDLSGSAGCNTYSGGFTAFDEELTISSPLVTGQMACNTPAGKEQLFLSLMEDADSFTISSGQLSIFDGSRNQILNFLSG